MRTRGKVKRIEDEMGNIKNYETECDKEEKKRKKERKSSENGESKERKKEQKHKRDRRQIGKDNGVRIKK